MWPAPPACGSGPVILVRGGRVLGCCRTEHRFLRTPIQGGRVALAGAVVVKGQLYRDLVPGMRTRERHLRVVHPYLPRRDPHPVTVRVADGRLRAGVLTGHGPGNPLEPCRVREADHQRGGAGSGGGVAAVGVVLASGFAEALFGLTGLVRRRCGCRQSRGPVLSGVRLTTRP
ncbi:DUF6354 family protein [Streptomyces lavendulae]|uniref:DUF6354 family protein n=1 Tax=Streptomyces lavendulae TaxID=1914 RepID=UPI00367D2180